MIFLFLDGKDTKIFIDGKMLDKNYYF